MSMRGGSGWNIGLQIVWMLQCAVDNGSVFPRSFPRIYDAASDATQSPHRVLCRLHEELASSHTGGH
jgi:hypothetical protein